jgi:hypothetical protein
VVEHGPILPAQVRSGVRGLVQRSPMLSAVLVHKLQSDMEQVSACTGWLALREVGRPC